MMDSTTAVVIMIILCVVLTLGILIGTRVLAVRESRPDPAPRPAPVVPPVE